MAGRNYISVIVPLKLDWMPCYRTDLDLPRGSRVYVSFAGRQYVGVVAGMADQVGQDVRIKEIAGPTDLPPVSETELRLWAFVADYYMSTIGEVYKMAYPAGKTVTEETMVRSQAKLQARLEKLRQKLEHARTDATRRRYEEEIRAAQAEIAGQAGDDGMRAGLDGPELTEAQKKADDEIVKAFADKKIALLHGITGSGKTEIYIHEALKTLREGRNVLYLVPEIALSRQLEERLRSIFGERLLTFHSGKTVVQRRNVATSLREGRYIVLGTRSALFLPHHDLGLIIIDEEHDSSYKQDTPAPRYNGRDTAIMLGSICGSNVILGSATPSLESLYNCEAGRYRLVSLAERYYSGGETDVEVIDTIAERRKKGMVGNFSRKLIEHIHTALADGGQVILLRGRRAYSPVVQCDTCGEIPKCPHCNVALSYHKTRERLVCHYCGYTARFDGKCPSCGGNLLPLGAGTQRIEEEAAALFPDARIARLDSDTGSDTSIIKSFAKGETDILIGTQIVTKGFDFEKLTLVAVLQADSLLGQQDFRADEKAMQILEQFRGRCARRGGKGLFVIQAAKSSHPVYEILKGSSGEGFISEQLSERKEFGYPPYSRIINIVLRDDNEKRLDFMARELYREIAPEMDSMGPFSPVVDKVSDQFIRQIRVMLPKDKYLAAKKDRLRTIVANFEKTRTYAGHIILDVDPV